MSGYTVPCRDFLDLYLVDPIIIVMMATKPRDIPIAIVVGFSLPLSIQNKH